MNAENINLGEYNFEVETRIVNEQESDDQVQILIPSKLLDPNAIKLINLCVQSIHKFTRIPYRITIVDNDSDRDLSKHLLEIEGVNIIFNRTKNPKEGNASFENAVGLELGRHFISNSTKLVFTMHQDTVAAKEGWLDFLKSKLNDQVKASGVREDKGRVEKGILHVLGYLVDYQQMQELGLDFYPDLPDYDVGDKVIDGLRNAGFKYFAAPNTIWQKDLIQNLQDNPPYKSINVDRSIDESGDVFFMHLGRGVLKSINNPSIKGKTSIEIWENFITDFIL